MMASHQDIPEDSKSSFINGPAEVDTLYIDGIKGISVNTNMTRISFFEQVMGFEDTPIVNRFVVNLAIANDQLRSIAELISRVADDNDGNAKINSCAPDNLELNNGKAGD